MNAALTVAADGRASAVRDSLRLAPSDYGVPIDMLWFRVPRPTKPMRDTLANIRGGLALVTTSRPGYFQCGLLIRKGTFPEFQQAGIEAFRRTIASIAPRLTDVTAAIDSACAAIQRRLALRTAHCPLPTAHCPLPTAQCPQHSCSACNGLPTG